MPEPEEYTSPIPRNIRDAQTRAVDVILDHLDPPSPRLGRTDWCINVEKIVRALSERGLLAHAAHDAQVLRAEAKRLRSFTSGYTRLSPHARAGLDVIAQIEIEADRIEGTTMTNPAPSDLSTKEDV